MKLAIFGSTGLTGRALVTQALDRGHEVTTLVRSPLDLTHPRLTVVRGSVLDSAAVRRVIDGSGAVLSALGFEPPLFGKKTTDLYTRSTAVFEQVMRELGVRRLLVVTSAGVVDDPGEQFWYRYLLKPLLLRPGYANMRQAEELLAGTSLAWTVVRPARLTNGKLTTTFRVSPRFRPPGGRTISRADLAYFMLNQLTSDEWVGQTPTLAY